MSKQHILIQRDFLNDGRPGDYDINEFIEKLVATRDTGAEIVSFDTDAVGNCTIILEAYRLETDEECAAREKALAESMAREKENFRKKQAAKEKRKEKEEQELYKKLHEKYGKK